MYPNESVLIRPDRLRQRRLELKLSQEEVSEQAGINQSTISQLERGEQTPTVRSLVALAHVLGTSIEWLLGMTEHMGPIAFNSSDLAVDEMEAVMLLRASSTAQRGQLLNILREIVKVFEL